MIITFFSFYMMMMWSSLFILLLYVFRKKLFSINFINVSGLLLIYLLCIIRIILPFEIPGTKIIVSKNLYNKLTQLMNWEIIIGTFSIRICFLLIGIWAVISIVLLIHLLCLYYRYRTKINSYKIVTNGELQAIIQRINYSTRKNKEIKILVSSSVKIPMSFGIFNMYILLPDKEYSSKQAFYILMHEYIHLRNGDQIVKLLINILYCIFWWNPFVCFLKYDLEQILEIKCDLTVIKGLGKNAKADYLDTIISMLKMANPYNTENPGNTKTLGIPFFKKSPISIKERFEIVSKYKSVKDKKRRKAFLYIFAIATLYLSYSFVIQSRFDIPSEDIETDKFSYGIEISESYIYKDIEGDFWLQSPSKESLLLDEDTVSKMIETGFQIKEKRT